MCGTFERASVLNQSCFPSFSHVRGWDSCSYGYHGDDGGIFHATGNMLRTYGPVYGKGDTVGCGVDYSRHAIFFTHNGKFLGYAFENLSVEQLQRDWYPVVGLDTNCPIVCNFGIDKPFAYDLRGMLKRDAPVLRKLLQA
jgi:hypothetical protein